MARRKFDWLGLFAVILLIVALAAAAVVWATWPRQIEVPPAEPFKVDTVTEPVLTPPENYSTPEPEHLPCVEVPEPGHFTIPSLCIHAKLSTSPVRHGEIVVPADPTVAGIWTDGGQLTGKGTVLMVGHVNTASQGPGVLFRLSGVKPGAMVRTMSADGQLEEWVVNEMRQMSQSKTPATDIYDGEDGPRKLHIVTCAGDANVPNADGTFGFSDNLIVSAVPHSG